MRKSRLTLRISCKWLDWQVSHLARILGQSPVLVSSVNHLSIDEDELQPGWQDDMDNADWPELLRPFTSLKTLHGSQKLGRHIALALDDISGEMVTEILPALGFLLLQDQPVKSVARFIAVRRLSGHPVTFVNQTPLLPRDVLIDGFVARTFTHEDANNYFMLLLRTPPSQYFLEYYGIVYDQGAWHITHNVNSVQGASPDVPLQTTPLLDHSIGETYGTVVPQLRWTPAHEVDVGHIEEAVLQLPIFFVNHNGSIGFGLSDILRGCDRDLHNASGFAPLGGKTTTHIRIKWPGYGPWSLQIATRDGTHARNPITLARFMKLVGISVDKFFRDCVLNIHVGTDSQWQIGIHGGIMQEEVKIVGVVQVSAGSWMPVMQLTRYVI
ncbi:hypothetical protein H4582DRAFT_125817 [Lactarius indigo]|nr:hypothetical protein H4582DRAFT_125817 [Lactarius indigo]